jgi:hypothetical protein
MTGLAVAISNRRAENLLLRLRTHCDRVPPVAASSVVIALASNF